jgi:hypothetical protein
MRDRSINEQLREEAERQGLLESVDGAPESESAAVVPAPAERQILTPLMIGVTTALDLVGVLVLLTVNIVAGVVVLALSGTVFALWLNLRLRRIRSSVRAERDRQGKAPKRAVPPAEEEER